MHRQFAFLYILLLLMLPLPAWCKPVVDVQISGLDGELLDNARAYTSIYQRREEQDLSDAWIKDLHENAPQQIRESLQPFGYYNASVEATLEKGEDKSWIARYVVDPGPQTVIAEIDIQWAGEGAEEPRLLSAVEQFPLQKGDPLLHADWESAKTGLITEAGRLGYNDIEATTTRVVVNPDSNTAALTIHLDTGAKYFLGEISLKQDILEEEFVKRYLVDIQPGTPYSQELLLDIQRSLVESGYFSLVDVKPRFDNVTDYKVPLDVELRGAKRQRWTFGLGYNTDVEVNGSVRWGHRRLNDRGHRADALLRLSTVELLLRGNYWIPIRDPRYEKLGITGKLESTETNSAKWQSFNLIGGYYNAREKWKYGVFTDFLVEKFEAGSESEETTELLSFGVNGEMISFEEGNYPRLGWEGYGDFRFSPGVISSTAYARLHLKGRGHLPVFERGRLIGRVELGATEVEDFDRYPASLRFFAGGDQSVRGYAYESLGPENEDGDVVGGKFVFTSSVEYNHLLTETLGGAVFVDAGNAYNDELDKLYIGAGVGMRYVSPVGLVRLDVAWPMNDRDDDPELNRFRIHFGFEVYL